MGFLGDPSFLGQVEEENKSDRVCERKLGETEVAMEEF